MANNGRVENTDGTPMTNGEERNQIAANGNGNHSESIRSEEGEISFCQLLFKTIDRTVNVYQDIRSISRFEGNYYSSSNPRSFKKLSKMQYHTA